MIKFQLWLRRVFGISKSESTGLLIFLPLVLFLIFVPSIVRKFRNDAIDLSAEEQRLNKLIAQMEIDTAQQQPVQFTYQLFDPNNVSRYELELMGVTKKTASNWQKYLTSGGRFNTTEDIKKVYGLTEETFDRIKGYVNIKTKAKREARQLPEKVLTAPEKVAFTSVERSKFRPFDLNKVDTITLKQLRGIGSVLSKRIIRFRESLGGFVNKDQLNEVWGLNEVVLKQLDTLAYLDPSLSDIRYLQINEATEYQLARHPYLSNKQASAIVAYRYQHGKFHQVSDLYNIHRVDSLVIAKISPYLEF
ncbi:helix-hairpin-helix domain-containing protein [Fulvivirga sp. 29W222]|uniref:Helix-hairpin-helix domain-containing protein n=1 Tax=Fulvivirga marina TaxID=2494733 RepID=A0A937KAQ6_9BACT|nr:helix-hairpin-helix domain-containing protein [Fulvivirga marina]MBL6444887.1 helix-hairpin-helix domain-containing protein [Fulvivirga marina]